MFQAQHSRSKEQHSRIIIRSLFCHFGGANGETVGTLADEKTVEKAEHRLLFSSVVRYTLGPPAARVPLRFGASTSHGNSHSSSFPKGLVFTRVRRVIWAATQGPFCITGRVIMAKPPRTDTSKATREATLQRYEFKLLLKQPVDRLQGDEKSFLCHGSPAE